MKREECVGIGAETKPKPAQDEEWWLKAFESAAESIPVTAVAVPEKPRERSNTVESDDVAKVRRSLSLFGLGADQFALAQAD